LSLFLVSCSVWPPSLLEAAFFFCYSSTALAGGYSCVTLTLTLTLPKYMFLALPQDVIRSVARFRLRVHAHPSLWDRNMEPRLLPYLWFVWGWWCPGWAACYFLLHTPTQCLYAGDMSPYSQRQEHSFYFFAPEQQQTLIFSAWMSRLAARFDWRPCLVNLVNLVAASPWFLVELWLVWAPAVFPSDCTLIFITSVNIHFYESMLDRGASTEIIRNNQEGDSPSY